MNVWHSSLTKENREDLERVQKATLKVILKKDYLNYKDALKLTNLETLEERREAIGLRFAMNGLKNQNFSKLFPLNSQKHVMKVRNPQSTESTRQTLRGTNVQAFLICKDYSMR